MKIRVIASVAIIETSLDLEDIKMLESVSPTDLTLQDEDGNQIFAVSVGKNPSISDHGIVLAEKRDIVLTFDKPVTQEVVMASYPKAFLRLRALETHIAQVAEYYRAQLASVDVEML